MKNIKRTAYKVVSILIAAALVFSIIASFFFAETNKPSDWALKEVEGAIKTGMVPEELQGSYQQPIKRSEYTALALRLFEGAGFSSNLKGDKPFPDISGSFYENTIIKAYNAGIIHGYPDKTFKPDNNITRQEIAKLIVNLIKAMYPSEDVTPIQLYSFYDNADIDDWAKDVINYCFENNIMIGIDKLVTMSPKGETTREQAIIMLYRLASSWRILDGAAEPVEITDILFYFSEPLFYNVLHVSEDRLDIKSIYEVYDIRITKTDGKLTMMASTKDAADEEFRRVVSTLLYTSRYRNAAWKLFEAGLNSAIENSKMNFAEQDKSKYLINGYTINNEDNSKTYILKLEEY